MVSKFRSWLRVWMFIIYMRCHRKSSVPVLWASDKSDYNEGY